MSNVSSIVIVVPEPKVQVSTVGGPQGPQGVPGQSAIQRTAASAMAAGQVVRTHASGQQMQAATTDLRTRPFDAILLGDIGSGATGNFHVAGPVPANVLQLGAGVACAVGVDATGTPVRATDPTCVSAPNWIGFCDVSGNVTYAPRRENSLNILDFGADPTGVTSSQLAFEAALSHATNAIVFVPSGTYALTATLFMPTHASLIGSGLDCILSFSNADGDGIRACNQPGTNTAWYVDIEDVVIDQTNNANRSWISEGGPSAPLGGAAIGILGGGTCNFRRVKITGVWRWAVANDGGETCDFEDLLMFNGRAGGEIDSDWSAGIWFAAGTRGFAVPDATNANHITHCEGAGPSFGFWLEGGSANRLDGCLVNLGVAGHRTGFALLTYASYTSIVDCYAEGSTADGAMFWFSGGVTHNIRIQGGLYTGSATPFARLGASFLGTGYAYGLHLSDLLIGCDWIIGSQFITGTHISVNNLLDSPQLAIRGQLYDTNPAMTGGLVANFGAASGFSMGTVGNPGNADHQWELKTFDRPLHLDASAGVNFRSYTIRSGSHTTDGISEVRSTDSGLMQGRRETKTHLRTLAAGSDVVSNGIVVPSRSQGIVRIFVLGMSAFDESLGAYYVIRQRAYCDAGGSLGLVGIPVTEVSDADAGFVSPTISVAGVVASATVKARSDGDAYWFVRVEFQNARP